ncbi:MAG: c-type cytochrome, partial [Prosthecobacter sp.]|nr:c-type cytochrome [Prosthecobacter sp.]
EPAGEPLAALLQPRETQEIHQAAVQALGMISDPRVAGALAAEEAWALYSTPIRTAALTALMARPERTLILMEALESGAIRPASIDPISRGRLASHADANIKARAAAVFSQIENSDRNAVYEEYKTIFASLQADPVAGREVFKNNCANCHRFAEDGFDVGPDLTGIRSQPRESILLHIIKPNSEVLAGFENFVLETANFETYSGIIVSENEDTVTIRGAMGVENTIPRSDIDSMSSASLSLMPEELEKVMTKQEMRDLISFLKGEKRTD